MVCQLSYPLNSENASPPGTFTRVLVLRGIGAFALRSLSQGMAHCKSACDGER